MYCSFFKSKPSDFVAYKPDFFFKSHEFIDLFYNFFFHLSLLEFLAKNLTDIKNVTNLLAFYRERNNITINYATYLLEINNMTLFFSVNNLDNVYSDIFLAKLALNQSQYTSILFGSHNMSSVILENEAFFSIGSFIYSKYIDEYFKKLEYL